jgi:Ca2+-transporting ATPase
MSLLPVLFGWPLMLMPIHVMFLQLIIDPTCSIVFEAEPEDDDAMRRPPRPPSASIFGMQSVVTGLAQGFALLACVLLVDFAGRLEAVGSETGRALTFITLAVGAVVLVFANRSSGYSLHRVFLTKNVALWPIALSTLAILGAILTFDPLREAFHFGPVTADALILPATAVVVAAACIWVTKRFGVNQGTCE